MCVPAGRQALRADGGEADAVRRRPPLRRPVRHAGGGGRHRRPGAAAARRRAPPPRTASGVTEEALRNLRGAQTQEHKHFTQNRNT